MMFFKSALMVSALLALTSALTVQHHGLAHEEMSILIETSSIANSGPRVSFSVAKSDCEKDDEADCKEFCSLTQQTATCSANGNKVTCYCKGGKSESNCEERCLLCMPDKSALEEASRLFKLGGSNIDEL